MAEKAFRTSLAGRSIVALVLFVGYYVLAFAVAGLLCLIPVAEFKFTGGLHLSWLPYLFFAAAALILWSVVPRPKRFKAPGPRLTPKSDPRLFEEIFRLARELGQKAPREAYLMPDVTAWVSERGGFMGFGRRRIAGVGLTLLQGLSVDEFRAVLAHEFGHFSRGDTRLGPWIYRTRTTIGRTLQELPALSIFGKTAAAFGSLIQRPFALYGNWFLRITQTISRQQEYSADEISAATAGRETASSALRKTFMTDLALRMYWESVLGPALNAGFLPPFAAGLGQFAEGEAVRGDLTKALSWHIENVRSEPHDSHPSLGERIKALAALPVGREPEPGPPAITLLEDVPRHERELLAFMNPQAGPKLKPIDWGDITAAALIPHWAELAKSHQADLAGVTPRGLPDRFPGLAAWGRELAGTSGWTMTDDQAKSYAAGVVAIAIVTKMIERGWQASYTLGQYTVLRHGERSWKPFKNVYAFAAGEITADEWLRLCDELGIGELELGPGEQTERVEPIQEQSGPSEAAAAHPLASEGQRRTKNIPWVLISLICLASLVMIFRPWSDGGTGSGPYRPSYPPAITDFSQAGGHRADAPDQTPSRTGPRFSLSTDDFGLAARVIKWSSGARFYGATVEVTNRSSKIYNFVMVRVEFCDRAGRIVGTLIADAHRDEYVLPGAVKSFTVTGNGILAFQTARASVVYAAEAK